MLDFSLSENTFAPFLNSWAVWQAVDNAWQTDTGLDGDGETSLVTLSASLMQVDMPDQWFTPFRMQDEGAPDSIEISIAIAGDFTVTDGIADGVIDTIEISSDGELAATITGYDDSIDAARVIRRGGDLPGLFQSDEIDSPATAVLNDGDNAFRGSYGGNTIKGLGGNDYLAGGFGDTVIKGGRGHDILISGYGNSWLNGGKGDDVLAPGAIGVTLMTGGPGQDIFSTAETFWPSHHGGVVTDFSLAEGDMVYLHDLLDEEDDPADLVYIGSRSFTGNDERFLGSYIEVRMENGIISADLDGDGVADADSFLKLKGIDSFADEEIDWLGTDRGDILTYSERAALEPDAPQVVIPPITATFFVQEIEGRRLIDMFDLLAARDNYRKPDKIWQDLPEDADSTETITIKGGALFADKGKHEEGDAKIILTGDFSRDGDAWSGTIDTVVFEEYGQQLASYADIPTQIDLSDLIAATGPRDFMNVLHAYGVTGTMQELVGDYQLGAGADDISGSQADDAIYGGAGDDRLVGRIGDDRLTGEAGDDRLIGKDGDDILDGEEGHDRAIGGAGDDTFTEDDHGFNKWTGGAGADIFSVTGSMGYLKGQFGTLVTDFSLDDGDMLYFGSDIDGASNQLRYIGDADFTDIDDGITEIRLANGLLTIDADADGIADLGYAIKLKGIDTIEADPTDWLLGLEGYDFV